MEWFHSEINDLTKENQSMFQGVSFDESVLEIICPYIFFNWELVSENTELLKIPSFPILQGIFSNSFRFMVHTFIRRTWFENSKDSRWKHMKSKQRNIFFLFDTSHRRDCIFSGVFPHRWRALECRTYSTQTLIDLSRLINLFKAEKNAIAFH